MPESSELMCVTDLQSFFVESLLKAARHQEIDAADATVQYLGGVLTRYSATDRLYDRTEDGMVRTPLVLMYKAAQESPSERERRLHLQRLGDVALFISGVFSGCLRRSLVDVDYYVSMGASAYGYLSASAPTSASANGLAEVFGELARRFVGFGDLLAEVCETLRATEESDPVRLDDLWTRTGSRRIARKLQAHGVVPGPVPRVVH